MFSKATSALSKKKNRVDFSSVLIASICSWGLAYLLTEYLHSLLTLSIAVIAGLGFVSLMHWLEVENTGVIENELSTIQSGSNDGTPFFRQAHKIKLAVFCLLALTGNSLIIFTDVDSLGVSLHSLWNGLYAPEQ